MNLRAILVPAILSTAVLRADERVFPPDCLYTESSHRKLLAEVFPDLNFGFYHLTGRAVIGVLEDFDHERILLVLRHPAVVEKGEFVRNGKALERVPREAATVNIGRPDHEGKPGERKNPDKETIGFWLPLAAEDTFSMTLHLQYPEEGKYHAFYSPDTGWRMKADLTGVPEQDRREHPADVYEVTRKSLLEQVKQVLQRKDACMVRKPNHAPDLGIRRFSADPVVPDAEPLFITLSDEIQVGMGSGGKVLGQHELSVHLSLYTGAARAAEVAAEVWLLVSPATSDKVFRRALYHLRYEDVRRVRLIDRPYVACRGWEAAAYPTLLDLEKTKSGVVEIPEMPLAQAAEALIRHYAGGKERMIVGLDTKGLETKDPKQPALPLVSLAAKDMIFAQAIDALCAKAKCHWSLAENENGQTVLQLNRPPSR